MVLDSLECCVCANYIWKNAKFCLMIWIINLFFFFLNFFLWFGDTLRMEMKSFLGSRGPLSWRSWWPLTVTVNLWISTLSLSCLMAVVSVLNRLQMRFRSFALYLLKAFPFSSCFISWNVKSPLLQLDMEEGDEIDAMLHQTGGVAIC